MGISHRKRKIIFEDGGSVSEVHSMLGKVGMGLGRVSLVAHSLSVCTFVHTCLDGNFNRGRVSTTPEELSGMAGGEAGETWILLEPERIGETAPGSAQEQKELTGPEKNVQQPAALQVVHVFALQSHVQRSP